MRGLKPIYLAGTDTEISLTYEANRDRGFIFYRKPEPGATFSRSYVGYSGITHAARTDLPPSQTLVAHLRDWPVLLSPIGPALAVPMENDPNGFEGRERLSPNRINS